MHCIALLFLRSHRENFNWFSPIYIVLYFILVSNPKKILTKLSNNLMCNANILLSISILGITDSNLTLNGQFTKRHSMPLITLLTLILKCHSLPKHQNCHQAHQKNCLTSKLSSNFVPSNTNKKIKSLVS